MRKVLGTWCDVHEAVMDWFLVHHDAEFVEIREVTVELRDMEGTDYEETSTITGERVVVDGVVWFVERDTDGMRYRYREGDPLSTAFTDEERAQAQAYYEDLWNFGDGSPQWYYYAMIIEHSRRGCWSNERLSAAHKMHERNGK